MKDNVILGYRFNDKYLLEIALTHKSYSNEYLSDPKVNNERLEFLGDSILNFIITDILLERFIDLEEGVLSRYRADIVNEKILAKIARDINLGAVLKLGKGEYLTHGFDKDSILASTIEAVIAAIYLDSQRDIKKLRDIILELFSYYFNNLGSNDFSVDFKTKLQNTSQSLYRKKPQYKILNEYGPQHEKIFEIEVSINEDLKAIGKGRNKKEAEQDAASNLLKLLCEKNILK